MNSLLFFIKMHKRAGFLRILREAYVRNGRLNTGLAIYSAGSLLVLSYLIIRDRDIYTYLGLLLIVIWSYWLWCAIKSTYRDYFEKYGDKLGYYKQERQYLRYLIFRDEVLSDGGRNGVSISDALAHIDIDLQTETTDVLATSLFVAAGISVFASLVSNLTGKLDTPYIVLALFVLVLVLTLGATVIGSLRSRKVNLLELRRYLMWLDREIGPNE